MAESKKDAKKTIADVKVKIQKGKIKSRVNYDVTFKYNGKNCIIAPRQEFPIPDFSKLGPVNSKEIIKLIEK